MRLRSNDRIDRFLFQSPSPQAAGPWTTVGVPKANSAALAAVVAAPAKPTTTAKPAALSRSGSAVQAAATFAKTSSDALPASADLLRWCKDALKGLDVSGEILSFDYR